MTQLVLHVGIPKTGSSAMQVAFVQQRDTLAADGVTYPAARNDRAASQGRTTGGNGTVLLPHLTGDAPDHDVLGRLRSELAEAEDYVLYSSEVMWRSRPDRMRELIEAASEVRVVAVVRDIVAHAVSSHRFMVAAGKYDDSLLDFVRGRTAPRYRPRLRERLEFLSSVADVRVVHYDSHRTNLLGAFTDAAFDKRIPLVDAGTVNQAERPANGGPDPEAVAALERLMADDVAWLNEHYLAATPLRISGAGSQGRA